MIVALGDQHDDSKITCSTGFFEGTCVARVATLSYAVYFFVWKLISQTFLFADQMAKKRTFWRTLKSSGGFLFWLGISHTILVMLISVTWFVRIQQNPVGYAVSEYLRSARAIACVSGIMVIFQFASGLNTIGSLIGSIIKMLIQDLGRWSVIYTAFLLAFGLGLYTSIGTAEFGCSDPGELQYDRCTEYWVNAGRISDTDQAPWQCEALCEYYNSYSNTVLTLFLINLGAVEVKEQFYALEFAKSHLCAKILWAMIVGFSSIIMLNILIALMTTTFQRYQTQTWSTSQAEFVRVVQHMERNAAAVVAVHKALHISQWTLPNHGDEEWFRNGEIDKDGVRQWMLNERADGKGVLAAGSKGLLMIGDVQDDMMATFARPVGFAVGALKRNFGKTTVGMGLGPWEQEPDGNGEVAATGENVGYGLALGRQDTAEIYKNNTQSI
jgi:hypothetical protein